MKRLIYIMLNLIATFAILVTTSYAWYTNYYGIHVSDSDKLSSNANYFASGDGTEASPYVITEARHLYNLAWLQDLGYFDADKDSDPNTAGNQKFYFELGNNIDMSQLSKNGVQSPIPSIGIDYHPFIGNFNGNGHTINNLRIDTDFDNSNYIKPDKIVLNQHTETITNNTILTSYVGLFGHIGPVGDITQEIEEKVSNFYIDNSIIKSTVNCVAGIIAGFVNTNVEEVGVHYSSIQLASGITNINGQTNISNYTLIGDYNIEDLSWDDKPTGTDDGLSYGGNFDVKRLMQRLALIKDNKASDTPSSYLPNVDTGSSNPTVAKGHILPLTVVNELTADVYTGADAKETVSPENIGYFCGNGNKTNVMNLAFDDYTATTEGGKTTYSWTSGRVPRTFFKRTGQNATTTSENIVAMTPEEISQLPEGIQNLIPSSNQTVRYDLIRLQEKYSGTQGDGTDKFDMKDSISYLDNTYTNVYLPNNGIWFKPTFTGKFRFVIYTGSNGQNFSLYKLDRDSNTTNLQTHFGTNTLWGEALTNLYSYDLPLYSLIYFEYDVSQEELDDNVEFLLANDRDGNGAYFLYLDIGINGGNEDDEEPDPITTFGSIDNIDFVYETSSGTLSNIANNTLYSEVFFQISGTTTGLVEFYFRRNNDDLTNNQDVVLYFPDSSNNGTTLEWSQAGKKGKAKDETCHELEGSLSEGGIVGSGGGGGSSSGPTITYNTVTYYVDEIANSVLVRNGSKVSLPTPTKAGYRFTGWYTNQACTELFDMNTAITDDSVVLYAGFEPIVTYTVTFNTNGGSSTPSQTVEENGLAIRPSNPTRDGYTFEGWYTTENFTEAFDFSTPITGDTTLYANWIENSSGGDTELSYNLNVSDLTAGTISAETNNVGNTIYSLIADSTNTLVIDSASVTVDGVDYSLRLKTGGSGSTTKRAIKFTVAEAGTLEVVLMSGNTSNVRELVVSDGSNEVGRLTAGATATKEVITLEAGTYYLYSGNSGINIYAINFTEGAVTPTPKQYTITFESDGSVYNEQIVTEGSIITEPTDPTRDGYTFGGWYIDENFTNAYNFNTPIENSFTLYAKWDEIQSGGDETTEQFFAESLAGGTGIDKNKVIYEGTAFTITNGAGGKTEPVQCAFPAVANDDSNLVFNYGLLPTGGARTAIVTANQDITITIYFTSSDSKFTTGGAGYGKGGELTVNGTQVETVAGNKLNDVAYAYTMTLAAGETAEFGVSSNRFVLFGLVAES